MTTATLAVFALAAATASAQSVLYSYDSANHLIQATATTGRGVVYQYDLAGHVVSATPLTPTALNLGGAETLSIGSAGQDALLSFTASAGESVTLNFGSITTTPANSPVAVYVYDTGGALIASMSGTTTVPLNLSNLAGGTYTVVVAPQNAATVGLQLASSSSTGGGSQADAPLPLWSLVLLAGMLGLMASGQLGFRRRLEM